MMNLAVSFQKKKKNLAVHLQIHFRLHWRALILTKTSVAELICNVNVWDQIVQFLWISVFRTD